MKKKKNYAGTVQPKSERKQTVRSHQSNLNVCVACIFLAIVTFVSFFPSLNNGFTNWDDTEYVVENPNIRDAGVHGIVTIATSSYSANYHPLTMLSYMAEYAVAKLNPQLYHIDNLLLHILNAVLLLLLIYLLTSGNLFVSIGVALLFALHPLRVESVAWVSERKDVLSGLWYILTLLMYTLFAKTGTRKWYWLSFAAFLLALLSKPMSVSLPVVLVLIDYFLQKKISRKLLYEKIVFVVFAALFCVITILVQNSFGAIKDYPMLALWQRICVPFYVVCFYLVKTIAPFNLSALYYFPGNSGSALNIQLICAPLLICAAVIVAWFKRLFVRPVIFGVLFFLVTLLPVMQIIPVGNAIVADRYTYLPMNGVYFICVWILWSFLQNKSTPVIVRKSLIGAGCIVLMLFAVLTFKQCAVWHDSLTLWNSVINASPSAVAYNNRGNVFKENGQLSNAVNDFYHATAIAPDYALARFNLGVALFKQGRMQESVDALTIALSLDSNNADAFNSRGIALLGLHHYKEALCDLNKAITMNPSNALYYNNRATANLRSGNINEAFADYDRALSIKPDDAEMFRFRGNAYAEVNKFVEAIDDYTHALIYKPDLVDAQYRRAQCYYFIKRYDKAAEDIAAVQQAGVKPDPAFVQAVMQAMEK